MSGKRIAYLELALAMALTGSSIVAAKLVVASFPVYLASALRFGVSAAIMLPLLLRRERGLPRISRRDWQITFLQTLCGVFLFSVFLLNGLKLTSAAEGGIITAATPAVLGMISFVFLREPLSLHKGLGILLSLSGIMAINLAGAAGTGAAAPVGGAASNALLGNLLVFGAVVGEALFSVFGKLTSQKVAPFTTAALMCVMGFLMFAPAGIAEGLTFDFSGVPLHAWLAVLYYAVFVTVIGFLLWFSGLAQVHASTAAVFTGVWPLSAVALSYAVLGESFHPAHLLGMACVLGGIVLITRTVSINLVKKAQSKLY